MAFGMAPVQLLDKPHELLAVPFQTDTFSSPVTVKRNELMPAIVDTVKV